MLDFLILYFLKTIPVYSDWKENTFTVKMDDIYSTFVQYVCILLSVEQVCSRVTTWLVQLERELRFRVRKLIFKQSTVHLR